MRSETVELFEAVLKLKFPDIRLRVLPAERIPNAQEVVINGQYTGVAFTQEMIDDVQGYYAIDSEAEILNLVFEEVERWLVKHGT